MQLHLKRGELLIESASKVGKLTVKDLLAFADLNNCELRIRFEQRKKKEAQ